MEDMGDSRPRPNLCGPCRSIFAHGSFQAGVRKPHHLTRDSFEKAVAIGCELCHQLPSGTGSTEYEWSEGFPHDLSPFHLTIVLPDNLNNEFFELLETKSPRTAFGLAEKSLSQHHTGHEDVLNLAEYWFQDCLSNHGVSCNSSSQQPWYPTRLLDISTELVRLFTPDVAVKTQPYATISYCWGREPFFRTTSSNLEQLQAGVLRNRFPQVFQDLMNVARRLNICYLWIDCYCIIQSNEEDSSHQLGSSSDWQREAGKIEKVYENSILNLGVAHTTSPRQTCFQNREDQPWRVLMLDWQPRPSDDESTYLVACRSKYHIEARGLFKNPLFSRGWVLQERLLCRRMLTFAHNQIYWECSEHNPSWPSDRSFKCESSPFGMDTDIIHDWERFMQPWSVENPRQDEEPGFQWTSIANTYSKLELTYPDKDKFFALNGIARRAASLLQDADDLYVAGMFRSSLLVHLRWTADGHGRRSTTWRAPSWSWLSMNGVATCPGLLYAVYEHLEVAKVLDVSVELCDPRTAFGPLLSASATFYCHSITGTIWEGQLIDAIADDAGFASFFPDDERELQAVQGEVVIAPLIYGTHIHTSSEDETKPTSAISNCEFRALRDNLTDSPTRTDSRAKVWYCLVLHKTQAGTYKRLGIVHVYESRVDSTHDNSCRFGFLDSLIEAGGADLTLI